MHTLDSHHTLARAAWLTAACLLAEPLLAGDSVRRYGAPTPGSGNIAPTIWVNGTPRPGDTGFRLRLERALGGTWAFPFLATRPADSLHGGVRFLVDTTVAVYGGAYFLPGQGDGGGSGDVPLPLPNNPGLIGQAVYVQAFTLDDFAPNPLGFAATSGIALVPALPAELLLARSVPGTPDPQTAIDLATSAIVDYDRTHFDEGSGITYAAGGAAVLQPDAASGRLRAFDTTTFPPTWRGNTALSSSGYPQSIVPTPDGTRAYVLYTGDLGSSPPIVAHDARAGAGLGQTWPGAPIQLEQVADPRGIVFTPDSRIAFVAALGPLSGATGSLTRIDVDPVSPRFHQATGRIEFAGRLAADATIAADGSVVYVPLLAAGGPAELALVDVATFTVRDMDAAAPGLQNLGGELSRPRTPLPLVLGRAIADPRGEEVYCATVGGVVRVNVASSSPNFRRVTAATTNFAADQLITVLALTDAADRLYAATSVHVVEVETRQFTSARAWPIGGTTALAVR